jgi:AraC-like DNA-binding protein
VALPALKAMIVDEPPTAGDVIVEDKGSATVGEYRVEKFLLARRQAPIINPKESIPTVVFLPRTPKAHVVVWSDADGKSALRFWDLNTGRVAHSLEGHKDWVTDIAFSWGFNDAAHFSRAFRARFGCSPRALRAQADAAR